MYDESMGLWKVLMNVSPRAIILSMSLASDVNLCHSFDTSGHDDDDDDDTSSNDDDNVPCLGCLWIR